MDGGMVMDGFGMLTDKTTFRIERLLPGPIERVWSYIADPEKRAEWFCAGAFDLRPGGKARFEFDHRRITPANDKPPAKYADFGAEVSLAGKILAAQPPRLLSFEWPEMSGDLTEVLIELTQKGDKVLLQLTHSKIVKRSDLTSTAAGWHTHLDILAAKLGGEKPKPFWATHTKLEGEYEQRLGA